MAKRFGKQHPGSSVAIPPSSPLTLPRQCFSPGHRAEHTMTQSQGQHPCMLSHFSCLFFHPSEDYRAVHRGMLQARSSQLAAAALSPAVPMGTPGGDPRCRTTLPAAFHPLQHKGSALRRSETNPGIPVTGIQRSCALFRGRGAHQTLQTSLPPSLGSFLQPGSLPAPAELGSPSPGLRQ